MAIFAQSDPARTIAVIVAVVILGGVGFFGGRYLMNWHAQKMQTAVEQAEERASRQDQQLEKEVEQLKQELAEEKPPNISEKRMKEVFGQSEPIGPYSTTDNPGCEELDEKLTFFFDYLDRKDLSPESGSGRAERDTAGVFDRMVSDLAANPPVVTGETRDIVSLVHNQAHFFRTLNKNRIEMVKKILATEDDILEPAMADFYAYYVRKDCCGAYDRTCMEMPVLYEYAGFFLQTLSGSGYLMRRDSVIRNLTRYYSVLIIDRANEENINRHGIDIRPHIDLTLTDLRNQDNLLFRDKYIARLQRLQQKYRQ
ncbi:MAG: hypothetical protein ACQERN_09530 [Thermodesulfobacteriota bacterium]